MCKFRRNILVVHLQDPSRSNPKIYWSFKNNILILLQCFCFQEPDENTLSVKTAVGESYNCFLPKQDEVNKESNPSYDGPSPLELLTPLFSKQACSYRVNIIFNTEIVCLKLVLNLQVDTYWIYEVCHGRHVRQYHNEREGKTQKEQEYFLGKWKIFDGLRLGKVYVVINVQNNFLLKYCDSYFYLLKFENN